MHWAATALVAAILALFAACGNRQLAVPATIPAVATVSPSAYLMLDGEIGVIFGDPVVRPMSTPGPSVTVFNFTTDDGGNAYPGRRPEPPLSAWHVAAASRARERLLATACPRRALPDLHRRLGADPLDAVPAIARKRPLPVTDSPHEAHKVVPDSQPDTLRVESIRAASDPASQTPSLPTPGDGG